MRLPLQKTISILKWYDYIIKTGFEKEDIIKSSVIKEGQIVDEYLYSIRKKWKKIQKI